MKKILSVVVPCYNEEEALPIFYDEITKVAKELKELDLEYIFINDGSRDKTLDLLKELHKKDKKVRYVSFSRNFGKEAGILAGFRHAKGDYVVLMDVDLQDPPHLLPEMYGYIKEGYDQVATRRSTRSGEPPIRSFFARAFYRLINKISKTEIVDGARDYRFMTRQMVDAILEMSEVNRFSKGIFGWVGFNTKWLSYENIERSAGETKWSFWKLFIYSLDGITAFSTAPLAMATFIGFFFCALSFVAIIVIFIRHFMGIESAFGWASMVTAICFLGGIQLLCMGILGQYLSKTYLEAKRRPVYIVKETEEQ
jgi:Glycosyltransferases involved in cell wall biogenesis